MASLTTVYFISLILASFAGMGSGWYGSTMSGGQAPDPEPEPEPAPEPEPEPEPAPAPETTGPEIEPPASDIEQTEPPAVEESLPNPTE